MELYQKYRPKTLDDFIGQDKVKKTDQRLVGARRMGSGRALDSRAVRDGKNNVSMDIRPGQKQ